MRRTGARIARAFALGATALAFAAPARGTEQPAGTLNAAYVADAMRADPLFADQLGVHRYDDRLDDYSARGHGRRMRRLRSWRRAFSRALANGMSLDDAADTHALLDTIDLELFEDATLQPFHTDPTQVTGVLGSAIYALTGRHYAPLDERLRHVAPRLRAVPGIVAAAETNLTRPTRVATLQAIDENAGNVALYAGLTAEAARAAPRTRRAIAAALPGALAALRSFSTFLKTTLLARSDRDPRVGATVYDRELLLQNGTTETRAQLVAAALDDFRANRAEMLRLAIPYDRQFFPDRTADEDKSNAADVVVRRVLDKLAGDHPSADAVFSTAKRDVAENEAFLTAHPIVALPQPDTLRVVPTPAFMAGFSGASLDPAGPFTPLAESYFYIDTIPRSWSASRVASYLRDFNDYELRLLSIHEAVPGHYVQFRSNDAVTSLVRRTFSNGSFVEGWAVYTEGMMVDAGYGDARLRLFQLKWRLREEANAVIDAEFHAGGLTRERCFDFLEREAYQESSEAETKWHRLALSHDQLTSYFVGLEAIRRAEAAERRALGPAFDLAAFNAALLRMGSVEPRYIEPLLAAVRGARRAQSSSFVPAGSSKKSAG